MSRGPGRVQRGVLAAIYADERESRWWTIAELTTEIYGELLTRPRVESVRRAVKSLAADGAITIDSFPDTVSVSAARVDVGERYAYRDRHYADRVQLFAHSRLSVEEETARAQFYDNLIDRLVTLEIRIDNAE